MLMRPIARDPDPASDRARQDVLDRKKIKDAFDDSGKRYGARKIWHELRRNNHDIARCTVERLMKAIGIKGVVRGQKPITTNPDRSRPCPDDKVRACRVKLNSPDRLNVLCFANAASKYTERLAEADIDPSVGSVGNDNTVRYKRCATRGWSCGLRRTGTAITSSRRRSGSTNTPMATEMHWPPPTRRIAHQAGGEQTESRVTRFDVARTQQPKSTVACGSLRFGLLRYHLRLTIGMVHKPDNSECSRHQPILYQEPNDEGQSNYAQKLVMVFIRQRVEAA